MENSNEWINLINETITKNLFRYYEYNHFNNIQEIGFESFGKVYHANWKNSHKVLKSFYNFSNPTAKEIVNEIKFHRQVKSHENIIHFYGITEDQSDNPKKYFLVMEYANNGTLRNYLKEYFDNLTWNDKLTLAHQLAHAVSYLHDEGIVHRDLHSNNILVHEGKIKLADFGLSKRIEESFNLQSKSFDTIAYADPKIFDQKNQKRNNNHQIRSYLLNNKSDIYSIGILLWEISSGRPPFYNEPSGTSNIDLDLRILQGLRETPVPNTPDDYVKLYTDCWNNEPDNRPNIIEVVTRLNAIILNQLSKEQPLNSSSHEKTSLIIQNFNKLNIKEIEPSIILNEDDFSIMVDEIIILLTNTVKGKVKQLLNKYFSSHNVTSQEIYDWLLYNQTNSNSIVLFGIFNYFGIEVQVDIQKAFKLYQKAADLGNAFAMDNLGNYYEYVDINEQKAFELYQKAANLGNHSGINNLGYCYDEGFGVDVDKQRAFELYQKAANLGNSSAQYNLATMYEYGEVVVKNIEKAVYWYKKSAEQGDEISQQKLDEFYID
ncbi:hypothetical protein RclHR1_03040003 [Rhizophagus clarus]|uniref:Kinase-like domain-containing protein n=1 Tax=Rhizophagus clarus TaxID=94130 RepID=A0A2Z6S030_9GLOM|nr:hypothetical protein RclHR1_03040003 [Rhizophagus clarus]GET04721.1 kinase-like domain-containing protein [Rhizophagus clarus]